MCLILIGFRATPGLPIVIAANRDERYDRPSEPPRLLMKRPMAVGGWDARAWGTWLGVNEHGVVVALTNYQTGQPEDSRLRSRGLLCLDALACEDAREAAKLAAQAANAQSHNPFNLIAVDMDEMWIAGNARACEAREAACGWHVIGNGEMDDRSDPRVARTLELLGTLKNEASPELSNGLEDICRDHGDGRNAGGTGTLCAHGKASGTRSSSMILIAEDGAITYRHAEGAPCRTAFEDVTVPWQK